jgi:hypothetical protein
METHCQWSKKQGPMLMDVNGFPGQAHGLNGYLSLFLRMAQQWF